MFKRRNNEKGEIMTEAPTTPNLDLRANCTHCLGTGKELTVSNWLTESIQLLPPEGGSARDEMMARFYFNLLDLAPHLKLLFPEDIVTVDPLADPSSSAGRAQRDRLLGALLALGYSYQPGNAERMQVLDTHLAAFGRAHAAFSRPDGTVRGATIGEYAAVWKVLSLLLESLPGWRAEMTRAWEEAYDYAASGMVAAQFSMRGQELYARTSRPSE